MEFTRKKNMTRHKLDPSCLQQLHSVPGSPEPPASEGPGPAWRASAQSLVYSSPAADLLSGVCCVFAFVSASLFPPHSDPAFPVAPVPGSTSVHESWEGRYWSSLARMQEMLIWMIESSWSWSSSDHLTAGNRGKPGHERRRQESSHRRTRRGDRRRHRRNPSCGRPVVHHRRSGRMTDPLTGHKRRNDPAGS